MENAWVGGIWHDSLAGPFLLLRVLGAEAEVGTACSETALISLNDFCFPETRGAGHRA